MFVPLSANKGGKGLLRSKLPQSFAPPVASATARPNDSVVGLGTSDRPCRSKQDPSGSRSPCGNKLPEAPPGALCNFGRLRFMTRLQEASA